MTRTYFVQCRICNVRTRESVRRRYHPTKHCFLGLRKSGLKYVCSVCNTNIHKGLPLVLSTQLPIYTSIGNCQLGLFATRTYKKGDDIAQYHGKVIWKRECKNVSDYIWDKSNGYVIDAADSTSVAKYANHYVHSVWKANCKLKNIGNKAILVASEDIEAGVELLWNYGKNYWLKRSYKLTKTLLIPLRKQISWRGNEEERKRVNDLLKQ